MTQMKQYHDLLQRILNEGIDVYNKRTGTICKTIIGCYLEFDMGKGFPALTTRKLAFKGMVGELLGFFRGYTNAQDFRNLSCQFWNSNANETKTWLNNPFRKGEDDLGDIYSKMWTDTETYKIILDTEENESKVRYLESKGYKYIESFYTTDEKMFGERGTYLLLKKNINQLEEVVRKIMTDPSDRRIILNGWDLSYSDTQALPACHVLYTFIPIEDTKTLNVVMFLRSMDFYLGTPMNIASTALLLSIVARLTGYTAGKVIIQGANAHLYENSFEVTKELLTREHFESPRLVLSDNIKSIESLEEIKGCFTRVNPEDINIEGYQSHGVLTVPMVA